MKEWKWGGAARCTGALQRPHTALWVKPNNPESTGQRGTGPLSSPGPAPADGTGAPMVSALPPAWTAGSDCIWVQHGVGKATWPWRLNFGLGLLGTLSWLPAPSAPGEPASRNAFN